MSGNGPVTIETIETSGLGDRTYVVHDGTTALVVDPQRDLDRVEEVLDRAGVRLTHVLETHLHNDYVSGGPVLAEAHGARYVGHPDDDRFVDHDVVRDGDTLSVGTMTVRALGTPGHTPNHLAYVVADGERDVAVFTGGSLLYGTVGRTDLVSSRLTEDLTRQQHASARRLAEALDDDVEVRPTHGFGSFCSSTAPDEDGGDGPTEMSTIGDEKKSNVALQLEVDEFVEQLLAGFGAYPRYYAFMSARNRVGADPIDLTPPVEADPAELSARIHAGEWVVDLRDRTAYAADHVRGTVNVEVAGSFVTYLGWLLPWNTPVTLVGESAEQVADAQRELVRIGIDRPAAAAQGAIDDWADGLDRGTYRVAGFADLAAAQGGDGQGPLVLDTRRQEEWDAGHVAGALHVPLHELRARMDEVPTDAEVWVHCASGYRSSIAASLLARAGRTPVLVDDHADAAPDAGVAWAAGD